MDPIQAFNQATNLCTTLSKNTVSQLSSLPLASSDGISLLDAKSATLLRYNLNLVRFAKSKLRGDSIQPIAQQLVSDWVALERIRPLEKKIRYRVDALLKSVSAREAGKESEAERFQRRQSAALFDEFAVQNLQDTNETANHEEEMVEEVEQMDMEMMEAERKKEEKERIRREIRVVRDENVREMVAELRGLPEQVDASDMTGVRKNHILQRLLREDEKRIQYEEDHMTRLSMSKKDKKRKREIERAMEGEGVDDMDEFSGLIAVADRVMSYRGETGNDGDGKKNPDRDNTELKMQQLDAMATNSAQKRRKKRSSSAKKSRRT